MCPRRVCMAMLSRWSQFYSHQLFRFYCPCLFPLPLCRHVVFFRLPSLYLLFPHVSTYYYYYYHPEPFWQMFRKKFDRTETEFLPNRYAYFCWNCILGVSIPAGWKCAWVEYNWSGCENVLNITLFTCFNNPEITADQNTESNSFYNFPNYT